MADGTHLLLQTRDVDAEGQIAWRLLAPYTPAKGNADRYTLSDGDVLLLARGARRVAATIRRPRPHTVAVSTFFILRPRDEAVITPEYLAWYLNVAACDELDARELQGTTMAFVPKEALATLPVDLPPSDVQHSIVALDALLRRERRLTDELLEQRARLVQTLTKRAAAGKER